MIQAQWLTSDSLVGATGYPIYVASLWYYDRVGKEGFPLFGKFLSCSSLRLSYLTRSNISGGAFLGFCAALFWTSAGFISYAYPEEKDKGLVRQQTNPIWRLAWLTYVVHLPPMGAQLMRQYGWSPDRSCREQRRD